MPKTLQPSISSKLVADEGFRQSTSAAGKPPPPPTVTQPHPPPQISAMTRDQFDIINREFDQLLAGTQVCCAEACSSPARILRSIITVVTHTIDR